MNTLIYPPILLSLLIASLMSGVQTSDPDSCSYEIVESIPDLLEFKNPINFQPKLTHDTLIEIIKNAKSTLRIASFYCYLSAEPEFAEHPSAQPGRRIMDAIVEAAGRGVDLQVVLDNSSRKSMSNTTDVERLKSIGKVEFLDMKSLLKGGVLHTKFLIADNETFYLGSSNFDWRSYTQIKEIGIRFSRCGVLAEDLDKIFNTYMMISELGSVPESLPTYLNTSINKDSPLSLKLGKLETNLYMGASPPAFNGVRSWIGRTDDIDGLLSIINTARHRIDISVMNYSPQVEFVYPKKFWPRIDDALRRAAAERHVRVRLLFTDWSKETEMVWYRSLNAVQSKAMKGSIHVKIFKVPSYNDFQKKIPFARVKHDKYMVTDNGLYIGTSNWAPDYFINTCGIGVVVKPKSPDAEVGGSVIEDMQNLFERDFTSEFSHELDD